MNILETVKSIIVMVKAVEAALPESGKGPEKLAAVKLMLSEAIEDIEAKWPQIEKIVNILVWIYNQRGVFKKG